MIRSIPFAIAVLLAGTTILAQEGDPLPLACDTLRALPADTLSQQSLDYQLTQDRADDETVMSMCTVLGDDGLPAATLLQRQDISGTDPQAALAQREAMIADLAETFGQEPDVTFPDIGEAAVYVADTKQLMVWYRAGRVMLIVTAASPDASRPEAPAERIAQEIVTRFP